MADTALDTTTLPLKIAAPDARVMSFCKLLPTTLPVERAWAELTRALAGEPGAVLWPTEVASIRALQLPLAQGSTLEERATFKSGEVIMHYRLLRFEPPHLLEYASLEGHPLAGGAVVSFERSEGKTVMRWEGEYRGAEPILKSLDRVYSVFFPKVAQRLQQLESAA